MNRFLSLLLLIFWGQFPATAAEKLLFDGTNRSAWAITDFAGHGEQELRDGQLILHAGAALSGIHYTNIADLPKSNYEVEVEARKIEGQDFFAAITFPVGNSHCTFVPGGWGGAVVGLSSIDGLDASENETTKYMKLEKDRWYRFKVRVTDHSIQAFIDDEQYASIQTKGRKIGLRFGEIELSKPLGVAAYGTASAIRKITLRTIEPAKTRVALIAGTKSHGPGEHEYEKSLQLVKSSLEHSSFGGSLQVDLHTYGWPNNPADLNDAATILLFSDGSDHGVANHPLLRSNRLEFLRGQMNRGAGLVVVHYSVFVPVKNGGEEFLHWVGGFFDYETGPAANKWFSTIETRDFKVRPVEPIHPAVRGIEPFTMREEFYYNMKFRENDSRWTPLLKIDRSGQPKSDVVAWAVQRADGGRGVGFTGGHFFKNWAQEEFMKFILNSIIWTAQLEVPKEGVPVSMKPVGQ
ncbi:MAG: ThuA domain-containing protein [Verrucomicrobiota bacterium]|nr:ThuA domain-containing protein [Verrucomicrobiota bacterium]